MMVLTIATYNPARRAMQKQTRKNNFGIQGPGSADKGVRKGLVKTLSNAGA